MGLLDSVFGGLHALIRGPKSLGSPDTIDGLDQLDEDSAKNSAYRQDIFRRSVQRQSTRTASDLINKRSKVYDDPLPEVQQISNAGTEPEQEQVNTATMSIASLEAKYGKAGASDILQQEMNSHKYQPWRQGLGSKKTKSSASRNRKAYARFLDWRATRLAGG